MVPCSSLPSRSSTLVLQGNSERMSPMDSFTDVGEGKHSLSPPGKPRKRNLAWEREYYRKNRAKRAEYEKEWRKRNPEKVQAQKVRYAEKHRERIRQKASWYHHNVTKKRWEENPSEKKKQFRRWNEKGIARWRRFLMEQRMALGGRCSQCGFDSVPRILQFHHVDPKTKYKAVPMIRNVKKALEEIRKCVLLCPNCHEKLHCNH